MYRVETDSLGECEVPLECLYGIQTKRALDNFSISGQTVQDLPELINALAKVKKAAALTNKFTEAVPADKADLIVQVCDEIIAGQWHEAFPIDTIQGGAGTSTNMNMNEVIANRGLEIIGHPKGGYEYLHPNDHVNCSQSTNDAYATAVRLSLYTLNKKLIAALSALAAEFHSKSIEFDKVEKLGRTQLQDAVPMTVGAELQAYAITLEEDIQRSEEIAALLLEVNLGGTAIGSRIGASEAYSELIIPTLAEVTDLPIKSSHSLYEASWDMGAFVLYSGLLKRIAVKLSKIANDMRLLSSGPFGGLGEYILPPKQPGSSIMPGKVNPVIPEALNLVCFKVFGADMTVTFAAESGQLQLNAFEPVIVQSLSEVINMLVSAIRTFGENCVQGLGVDEWRCQKNLSSSMALATRLVLHTGYEAAAGYAKAAMTEKMSFIAYMSKYQPHLLRHL